MEISVNFSVPPIAAADESATRRARRCRRGAGGDAGPRRPLDSREARELHGFRAAGGGAGEEVALARVLSGADRASLDGVSGFSFPASFSRADVAVFLLTGLIGIYS